MNGERMAAMSCDGSAAMKALTRLLKADVGPNAIFIHCFAHCNELIVKDAIKLSILLLSFLELCQSFYAIVGAYPKHVLLFEEIQNDFKNEMVSNATDYSIFTTSEPLCDQVDNKGKSRRRCIPEDGRSSYNFKNSTKGSFRHQ